MKYVGIYEMALGELLRVNEIIIYIYVPLCPPSDYARTALLLFASAELMNGTFDSVSYIRNPYT